MLESFEMSDFEDRLQKAIQRGQQARVLGDASQEADAATEEEMRLKHSQFRNELSEHIENCLRKLCDHFPGFDYSTVLKFCRRYIISFGVDSFVLGRDGECT